MSPNTCQCHRCLLVEQMLDALEAAGGTERTRRAMDAMRVREWVGKGYGLECVESAIARAVAGREAEGATVPINLGLVERLMQGAQYMPLYRPRAVRCPFATAPAGAVPHRAGSHPSSPAAPSCADSQESGQSGAPQ